jgi:acyl-CoA thioester hydrolase
MSKPLQVQVEIDVAFCDVDAMEVVWHGHYAKYFETARTALLRRIDYDYPQMRASGYQWPIVEMHTKFVRPARYGERVRVVAELAEYENRLKIAYEIHDAQGVCLTKGYTIQLAVDARSGELMFVAPSALVERVEKCR